jgi:hypothetical protein
LAAFAFCFLSAFFSFLEMPLVALASAGAVFGVGTSTAGKAEGAVEAIEIPGAFFFFFF